MSINVHLIHGFNVTDGGAATTGMLLPYLGAARLSPIQHSYGWFGFIQVRLFNQSIARRIADQVREGDIGIGHSNGCAILADCADAGARFDGLVFINPALDTTRVVAGHIRWVDVYHNRGDYLVSLAARLWWHPWGSMGRWGFQGDDARYTNIDCWPSVSGHSDIFTKLETWGPKIAARIIGRINDVGKLDRKRLW